MCPRVGVQCEEEDMALEETNVKTIMVLDNGELEVKEHKEDKNKEGAITHQDKEDREEPVIWTEGMEQVEEPKEAQMNNYRLEQQVAEPIRRLDLAQGPDLDLDLDLVRPIPMKTTKGTITNGTKTKYMIENKLNKYYV